MLRTVDDLTHVMALSVSVDGVEDAVC
jgi:hypothetical protein